MKKKVCILWCCLHVHFSLIIFHYYREVRRMDDLWSNAIKKAIADAGITKEILANKLAKSETEVDRLINGKGRISLEELYQLCSVLHLDIKEVFNLSNKDIGILVTDDLQAKVNEIARNIPSQKRPYFLRALLFLAQCFRDV